jgi:hypothetical protein
VRADHGHRPARVRRAVGEHDQIDPRQRLLTPALQTARDDGPDLQFINKPIAKRMTSHMPTDGGARNTVCADKAAYLELIDWNHIAYPYLDEEAALLQAVTQRAKSDAPKLVMYNGEIIYGSDRFTCVDRDGALKSTARRSAEGTVRQRGSYLKK